MKDPFELLVEEHGAYAVAARMRHMESFRLYYRRWPYDDTAELVYQDLDNYIDEVHLQPHEQVEADNYVDKFIEILPPNAKKMALTMLTVGGNPRDLPGYDKGREAVRFAKFDLKRRWREYDLQNQLT